MPLDEQPANDAPADDLRASLNAALEAAEADAPTEAAPPAPADPKTPPVDGDRPRDPAGRFAPKDPAAPTPPEPTPPSADNAQPADTTAQDEPSRAPHSLSAEAKAIWSELPPIIQQEWAKRERDIAVGFEKQAKRFKPLEQLEEVFAPHRDRWAMQGVTEVSAVSSLLAAQSYLERDPINAIAYLAKSFGVDLRRYAQAVGNAQQPQGGQQLPPDLAPILQEVQTLKNRLAERDNAEAGAQRQSVETAIQAFAANPSNLYFSNVETQMAHLITSGLANGATAQERLQDAYDRACWADPAIRPLILKDQSKADQATRLQQDRARTDQARKAAGSITGSPVPGAAPGGAPSKNLREELERNFAALG